MRTYVRSQDGTSGVWFFSLDAARLGVWLHGHAADLVLAMRRA